MQMEDNIDFAIRSIEIYEDSKTRINHEFTLICGVLLNILSAIKPDSKYIIDLSDIGELPKIQNRKYREIKKYLDNIRNGLSHKTHRNFKDRGDELTGRISEITINSDRGPRITLAFSELIIIFESLKEAIVKKYPDKFVANA